MKPKLFESLIERDGEFKEHVENMRHRATVHPFLKRYCEMGVREGLFSDSASALGRLHARIRAGAAAGWAPHRHSRHDDAGGGPDSGEPGNLGKFDHV